MTVSSERRIAGAGLDRDQAGFWLVDVHTRRPVESRSVNGVATVIPAGQTVGSLLDDGAEKLECGMAILRQLANDLTQAGDVPRALVIDGVATLVEQARSMQGAAHEALLEAAITIGQL